MTGNLFMFVFSERKRSRGRAPTRKSSQKAGKFFTRSEEDFVDGGETGSSMASSLENDLHCSVCRNLFKDPVILSCSHSFCRACVHSRWTSEGTSQCPLCRTHSEELSGNLTLSQICESFQKERAERRPAVSDSVCPQHGENLRLFCLDHREPVCLVCRDSRVHGGHEFRPVDEAAQQHREQLREKLRCLKENLEPGRRALVQFDLALRHVKLQARNTEAQIRETFQKLRRFLEEEEEARLAALREEEQRKVGAMKEKMEALRGKVDALSHTVGLTEEALRAEDVSFLLCCRAAEQRVQMCSPLEDTRLPPGALIQQAKHLGNLTFNIWTSMKHMVSFSPVVLDPNTADPELLLSRDLAGASPAQSQQLPENPERLADSVLGSEGLSRGTHCWDVQLGEGQGWELGLLEEVVVGRSSTDSGSWALWFFKDSYSAVSPLQQHFDLPLTQKFHRIRVKLDFNGGRLSFSDPDSDTHIHTFTHTFTQRMFPYVRTINEFKILPVKVSVRVGNTKRRIERR